MTLSYTLTEQSGGHAARLAAVTVLGNLSGQRRLARELTAKSRTADPSRDLLFGLIDLQNGLIDQDQLVNAFRAWNRSAPDPTSAHS
jgi:hypothetical protein